jgi:3-dehydroquinate synthetase
MAKDKKVRDGRLTLVLGCGIGKAFLTQDVDIGELSAHLARATAA